MRNEIFNKIKLSSIIYKKYISDIYVIYKLYIRFIYNLYKLKLRVRL